jgi:hypothetical protein
MSQPTSRSQIRIVIVEDHVLFAESLELALTVEGYDVRRMTVPDNGTWAASGTGCGWSRRWPRPASTWSW